MKFTRRKFIQAIAFVCTAPVINKIDGIAMVNLDSCVPNAITMCDSEFMPIDVFREVAENLVKNGMIPGGKTGYYAEMSQEVYDDISEMILKETI